MARVINNWDYTVRNKDNETEHFDVEMEEHEVDDALQSKDIFQQLVIVAF